MKTNEKLTRQLHRRWDFIDVLSRWMVITSIIGNIVVVAAVFWLFDLILKVIQ